MKNTASAVLTANCVARCDSAAAFLSAIVGRLSAAEAFSSVKNSQTTVTNKMKSATLHVAPLRAS